MTSNASRPRLEVNVPIKASPLAKSSTSVAVSVPTRPGSPSPAPSRRSINPTLKCSDSRRALTMPLEYLTLFFSQVFKEYHLRSTGANKRL